MSERGVRGFVCPFYFHILIFIVQILDAEIFTVPVLFKVCC